MKDSRSNSQLLQSTQQSQWSSQRKDTQKLSAAQIKEFLNESEHLGEQNEQFANTLQDKNAIEKIMMKQTFLQKNELFDPIDYFGGLKVPDLALTIQDTRLSDMFKPTIQEIPCNVSRSKSKESSATSTPSLIKQKSVASFAGLKPTSKYQQSQHQPSPQTSCLQNYPLRSGNKSPPRSTVIQDKENFEGIKKTPNPTKSHHYSNSTNVLCDLKPNNQTNTKQCLSSQVSTVQSNQSTEISHLKPLKNDFLSQINNFNSNNNNTMTIIQSSSSSPSKPIPQSLPIEQASLHSSSSQTHIKKMSSWAIFAELNSKSKIEDSGIQQQQQDQILCKNLNDNLDASPCSNATGYENQQQPFRTPVENSLSESGISVKDILRGLSNSGSSNKKESKNEEKGSLVMNEKDKKFDKVNILNNGINTKTSNMSNNIWKKENTAVGFSGRMQMLASMEQLTLETQPQWGNNSQISSNKAGSTVPSSSSSQTSNYSSNLGLVKKAVFNGRADMNRAGSYQLKKQPHNQEENRNGTVTPISTTSQTTQIPSSVSNQKEPHQQLDPLHQLSLGLTLPITKKTLNLHAENNIIMDQHSNTIQSQQFLSDNASLFLNRQHRHAPIQALENISSLNSQNQNNLHLQSPTVSYYKTTQQIDSKKILAESGASSASEVVMLATPLDQQFKNIISPKLSSDNEQKCKSQEETISTENCNIQSSENICNMFRKSSGEHNNTLNKQFSMASLNNNSNQQTQQFNHILHEDKSIYTPSAGFNSNTPSPYLPQNTLQNGFQHHEQSQFYSNNPSAYSSISQGIQDISTIPQLFAPEHLTRAKMFEQKLTSEQFFKDKENLELTFQEDTVPDENECDIPCQDDDEEQPEGKMHDKTQESYATFCGRTEKCFDVSKNNINSDIQNLMVLDHHRSQLVQQANQQTVMKPSEDGRVSRLLKNKSISTLNSSNNTKQTSNSRSKTRKENTSTSQNQYQTRGGTAYFVGNTSKNNNISQYRSNEVSKLRERDNSNTTKGNTSTQGQVSTSRSHINKSNNNISVIADKSLSSKKITNSISSSQVGVAQNSLTKKHLHNYLSNRNEGSFMSPSSQYTNGHSHSQERSNSAINKSGLLNLGNNNNNTSKDTGNSINVSQIQQSSQISHPSSYLKRPTGKTASQFDYRSSNLCQKTKQPQQDSRAVCSPSCSPSSYKVQAPACQTARPKKIINRLDCSRTYTSAKQISQATSISISSNVSSLQGAPSAKFASASFQSVPFNQSKQIIMIQPSTVSSSSSSQIQEQLEKEMRQQGALESRRQALRVDQKYEGTLQNLMHLQNQKIYQVQSPGQSSGFQLSKI